MSEKLCFVTNCTSTSVKYPLKWFVPVPKETKRRMAWFESARRVFIPGESNILQFWCCCDHFNVETDTETCVDAAGALRTRLKHTVVPRPVIPQQPQLSGDASNFSQAAETNSSGQIPHEQQSVQQPEQKPTQSTLQMLVQKQTGQQRQHVLSQQQNMPPAQQKSIQSGHLAKSQQLSETLFQKKSVQTSQENPVQASLQKQVQPAYQELIRILTVDQGKQNIQKPVHPDPQKQHYAGSLSEQETPQNEMQLKEEPGQELSSAQAKDPTSPAKDSSSMLKLASQLGSQIQLTCQRLNQIDKSNCQNPSSVVQNNSFAQMPSTQSKDQPSPAVTSPLHKAPAVASFSKLPHALLTPKSQEQTTVQQPFVKTAHVQPQLPSDKSELLANASQVSSGTLLSSDSSSAEPIKTDLIPKLETNPGQDTQLKVALTSRSNQEVVLDNQSPSQEVSNKISILEKTLEQPSRSGVLPQLPSQQQQEMSVSQVHDSFLTLSPEAEKEKRLDVFYSSLSAAVPSLLDREGVSRVEILDEVISYVEQMRAKAHLRKAERAYLAAMTYQIKQKILEIEMLKERLEKGDIVMTREEFRQRFNLSDTQHIIGSSIRKQKKRKKKSSTH